MTLRNLSHNLGLNAAAGYDDYKAVNKFGRNESVAIGVEEEIWDGSVAYVYPTDATTMTHIRAATDSAITRGAVIEVQGLNASWALVVQTKALDVTNSTTEIELDTALIRCFRMKVLDDTLMDVDVWLGDDDFVVAAAKAIIKAGNNQTLMAIYTVPAGKNAYMTSYYAAINPATVLDPTSCPIRLWARDNTNGYARQIKHVRGIISGGFQHTFDPPYKFDERTDIFITATPVGKAADVSAGFDLILIDD